MAKSRSKSASRASGSRNKKKAAGKSARGSAKKSSRGGRSALRMDGGDSPLRTLKAGDVPDDIELLNVHRYPESMPASVVAFVRNDRNCQRRLEELVKGTPGKRGQSGFNQLFQQKLDESAEAPTVMRADDRQPGASAGSADAGDASGQPKGGPPPARPQQASGGIGGFFRKLFS